MHISSSYAKILGETNFHTREFPRSGSKANDGERKKERERERLKVGNNNDQLRIATPLRVAHAKPPGPIIIPVMLWTMMKMRINIYLVSNYTKIIKAQNTYTVVCSLHSLSLPSQACRSHSRSSPWHMVKVMMKNRLVFMVVLGCIIFSYNSFHNIS